MGGSKMLAAVWRSRAVWDTPAVGRLPWPGEVLQGCTWLLPELNGNGRDRDDLKKNEER